MTEGTVAGRAATCPDCSAPTLAVQLPYMGRALHLEDHGVPVTADLAALVAAYEVWEFAGPRIGWVEKYSTERTWRQLRARHRCAQQQLDVPAHPGGSKHQHENQKENTQP